MSHAFTFACVSNKRRMLKISVVESHMQRRVIVEGKLIAPWVAELRSACGRARADLEDRELIIDLKNITAVSQEGENLLLELMKQTELLIAQNTALSAALPHLERAVRDHFEAPCC